MCTVSLGGKMSRFNKTHKIILEQIEKGLTLMPMTGSGFGILDDGFVLTGHNGKLTGFSEIMPSNVKFLLDRGYLKTNNSGAYSVTKEGRKKIGLDS